MITFNTDIPTARGCVRGQICGSRDAKREADGDILGGEGKASSQRCRGGAGSLTANRRAEALAAFPVSRWFKVTPAPSAENLRGD